MGMDEQYGYVFVGMSMVHWKGYGFVDMGMGYVYVYRVMSDEDGLWI